MSVTTHVHAHEDLHDYPIFNFQTQERQAVSSTPYPALLALLECFFKCSYNISCNNERTETVT